MENDGAIASVDFLWINEKKNINDWDLSNKQIEG